MTAPHSHDEGVRGSPGSSGRRTQRLLVILAGYLLVSLDGGFLLMSVPAMREELHADLPAVQLVLVSSTTVYALVLITGGRLGDMFGQRRLFLVGVSVVAVGALGASLAPTTAWLVAMRVIIGLAFGLMTPQVLGIIQLTHAPTERPRALAFLATAIGLGGAIGQVLGGLLVDLDLFGLSWRVPSVLVSIVAVATALTARGVLPRTPPRGGEQLDIIGVVLASATMGALLTSLVVGQREHWPPSTFLILLATAPGVWLLVRSQRHRARVGKPPLVDLDLFRLRSFRRGIVFCFVLFLSLISNFVPLTLSIQEGLGYRPLASAAITAVVPAMFMVVSRATIPLVARWRRHALLVGLLTLVSGITVLLGTVVVLGDRLEPAHLIPGLVVWGTGQGLIIPLLFDEILHGVPSRHASTAAAVLTTSQQLGAAVGIALVGLVYNSALGTGTGRVGHTRALRASEVAVLVLSASLFALLPLTRRARAGVGSPATPRPPSSIVRRNPSR